MGTIPHEVPSGYRVYRGLDCGSHLLVCVAHHDDQKSLVARRSGLIINSSPIGTQKGDKVNLGVYAKAGRLCESFGVPCSRVVVPTRVLLCGLLGEKVGKKMRSPATP